MILRLHPKHYIFGAIGSVRPVSTFPGIQLPGLDKAHKPFMLIKMSRAFKTTACIVYGIMDIDKVHDKLVTKDLKLLHIR